MGKICLKTISLAASRDIESQNGIPTEQKRVAVMIAIDQTYESRHLRSLNLSVI